MPKTTTTCKCPSCGRRQTLDDLKANLPDDMLKRLWASYGSRSRTGRAISPENQRRMQEARRKAKEAAAAAEGGADE